MASLDRQKLLYYIDYWISVEPLSFFAWAAFGLFSLARSKGIYILACEYSFGYDVTVDCYHAQNIFEKAKVDRIQKTATLWNMYLSLALLLPSIPSNILLGKFTTRQNEIQQCIESLC